MYAGYLGKQEIKDRQGYLLMVRNFYGALRIQDDTASETYGERTLTNGTINHGSQLLDDSMRYTNTSYYGDSSGVGRALHMLQARGAIRYGVVGLGAGVLSNYGRAGDTSRIFEINPLVENIAQKQFTFFPHSQADKKILMGDARLTMERLEPQNFDLLAVDAFSSDAIPVHLLTRETMQLYARHLKPNGILALHISNRYLNLEPVCEGGAEFLNRQAWTVADEGDGSEYLSSSTWVLVTADASLPKSRQFVNADISPSKTIKGFRPWTDDYSNIVQILRLEQVFAERTQLTISHPRGRAWEWHAPALPFLLRAPGASCRRPSPGTDRCIAPDLKLFWGRYRTPAALEPETFFPKEPDLRNPSPSAIRFEIVPFWPGTGGKSRL